MSAVPFGPPESPQSPRNATKTRTLAIIKPHAIKHRHTIEPRIIEAGFEIIKERMMQFDGDSDMDYLQELFGDDALTLMGEPIWVYVLERHRAVEVWLTLMGDRDPAVASKATPNCLRAVYGQDLQHNAVAGPSDIETADSLIQALFESSPPFPPIDSRNNSLRSVATSILSQLRDATPDGEDEVNQKGAIGADGYVENMGSDEGYPPSAASTAGKAEGRRMTIRTNPSAFKARAAPTSTRNPISQPKTTKAAALRAGQSVPIKPRPSSATLTRTFENVPGHKRSQSIQVASTAVPTIVPRLTKAASLRMGIKDAAEAAPKPPVRPKLGRPSTADGIKPGSFEGVPGHKRRETISVASTKVPTVAPRVNRSAMLRQRSDTAPPSSYMFKRPVDPSKPASGRNEQDKTSAAVKKPTEGVKRRPSSVAGVSAKTPAIAPRSNKSAMLRALKEAVVPSAFKPPPLSSRSSERSITGVTARPGLSRGNSSRSVVSNNNKSTAGTGENGSVKEENKVLGIKRRPSIAPRTNRSAELRAQMKENIGTSDRVGIVKRVKAKE